LGFFRRWFVAADGLFPAVFDCDPCSFVLSEKRLRLFFTPILFHLFVRLFTDSALLAAFGVAFLFVSVDIVDQRVFYA
jgi:hypothetical protein